MKKHSPYEIKQAFQAEISAGMQLNLGRSALLMAQYLSQPFYEQVYLNVIDSIANTLRPRIDTAKTSTEIVQILGQYLFKDLKFGGSEKDYYHPHNSFLNKVIDLRIGIPISLSVLYLEVGWRLGLPFYGINMPTHFIVGYGQPQHRLYIDVFNGGRIISEERCMQLAGVPLSEASYFRREFLKPAPKTAILYRMLLNLKHIYLGLEHWSQAYRTVDLMLVIHPEMTNLLRDRAVLAYRLQRFHDALFDLQQYLFLEPDGSNSEWAKHQLQMMETEFLRLN